MWWKKNKWKVIIPVIIVAVLAAAFWYGDAPTGGNEAPADSAVPETHAPTSTAPDEDVSQAEGLQNPDRYLNNETSEEDDAAPEQAPSEQATDEQPTGQAEPVQPPAETEPAQTEPVETEPAETEPAETEPAETEPVAYTCTISISCATILDNMELLGEDKAELIPSDGWILGTVEMTFSEGESVFDVLQRACIEQGIHMEYMNTPLTGSAYIEGIGNIYEFDAGSLSGWMYSVNGWFPNYGCSQYQLADGDVISWVYTCDLGNDVGGGYAAGMQ